MLSRSPSMPRWPGLAKSCKDVLLRCLHRRHAFFSGSFPQFISEYRQRERSTSESGEIGFLRTENCHDSAPGPMSDGFPAAIDPVRFFCHG